MQRQIDQVEKFYKASGSPQLDSLDGAYRKTLGNLQKEEAQELYDALVAKDDVEVADAIIDNLYVAIWVAIVCGHQKKLVQLFDAVQKSNMSKLDPKTKKILHREDGKIIKGPNYIPPTYDIKKILGIK